jgi:signal peptidase I
MFYVLFWGALISIATYLTSNIFFLKKRRDGGKRGWASSKSMDLAIILFGFFAIKWLLVDFAYVPSESMEPALKPGDRILVSRLSYGLIDPFKHRVIFSYGAPNKNDVVIFRYEFGFMVKRVAGLPGDEYRYCKDNWPHYALDGKATPGCEIRVLGEGKFFLLGDNHVDSKDSRFIGPVDGNVILGRAFMKFMNIPHKEFVPKIIK